MCIYSSRLERAALHHPKNHHCLNIRKALPAHVFFIIHETIDDIDDVSTNEVLSFFSGDDS